MLAFGLAAGASEEVTRGQDRIRARMDRQMEEARQYAKLAAKRQVEADAVKTDIQNTSRSYGINPQVLFSAYKNGHYDQYKGLIEDVRQASALRGTTVDGSTLEGLYTVPQSVIENPEDFSAKIDEIFGVVKQGLPEAEPDDAGIGSLLLRGLGVDDGRGLERATVQGYGVQNLLDMPLPSNPVGDGGKINPEAYVLATKPTAGENSGTFTPQYVVETVGGQIAATISSMLGTYGVGPNVVDRIEAAVKSDLATVVEPMGKGVTPAQAAAFANQIIEKYVVKDENGVTYVDTFTTPEVGGERIFIALNPDGTPNEAGRVPESQIKRAQATAPEEVEQPAPTEEETALSPEGAPLVHNDPQHGRGEFVGIQNGRAVYRYPSGVILSYPISE